MAVDKLGHTPGLHAALRAEAAQRKLRTPGGADATAEGGSPRATRRDPQVLRKQLADVVRHVDVRDPEAVRKARPQMVRTILLWEFGADLREHPEWQAMLESITNTLDKQGAGHEAEFVRLIQSLKR